MLGAAMSRQLTTESVERGQEVGMARQDAKRAGFVLRPQMRDIVGFDHDGQSAW